MLPEPNWINVFKLPTQVMIGLFIASIVLLGLDWVTILNLAVFGKFAKPGVIALTVISGSLSLTGIGAFVKDQLMKRQKNSLFVLRRQLRLQERENERTKAESSALERIDHLSPEELRYLADCLKKGSQSFYTYVYSPSVAALMGKGLVYTPGGSHHQDHYPYTIQDFAWKALLAKKDEILSKDSENRKREKEERRNS